MKIRNAQEKDIEGILGLLPQIYRVEKLSGGAEVMVKSMLKKDNCEVFVVEDEGKIVGTANLFYFDSPAHGKPYAFLEGMVVDENQRGKGIGAKFTEWIKKHAKEKGCYKMIFTSGFDREEAHKFYEKLGFKKWGYEFRMDL